MNLESGRVEYLQVPVQVIRKVGRKDEVLWDKSLPNDMKNAYGFKATQDKRNAGSGWRHAFFRSARRGGRLDLFPDHGGHGLCSQMECTVLNEEALVSWSDLGPAGKLGLCRAWLMRMGVCMPARSRNCFVSVR